MRARRSFDDLVAIMDRLRDPGGCPWDREQTYETLRGYLIEECYEAVDAIDREDRAGLAEELGDLLLQVVFLSRLGKEDGAFDAGDVVEGIAAKLVRRHPHVFGDETAGSSGEVLKRWEEIKREEKSASGKAPEDTSVLAGIPRSLPALVKAQRLGTKAGRVGFDWTRDDDVVKKLEEETGEIRRALAEGSRDAVIDEIGDALFTVTMLARRLEIDADAALARANAKFERRFRRVEAELSRRGVPVAEAPLDLMERLWEEAKAP
ncbi:MAG TPA: nucleoside triphosphate pyrophosphohydrolase [Candidatus Polarisedimenticolaceae bacterium]|nr:nucleoside triphosphate pyrophosphohydrolase [Candidatus Polarisedimenticolaceae bacterium]